MAPRNRLQTPTVLPVTALIGASPVAQVKPSMNPYPLRFVTVNWKCVGLNRLTMV